MVRNSPKHYGSKWGHFRLAHSAVGGVTSAGAAVERPMADPVTDPATGRPEAWVSGDHMFRWPFRQRDDANYRI